MAGKRTKSSVVDGGHVEGSFGFNPAETSHHFEVHIPRSAKASIEITEHYVWNLDGTKDPGQLRVILPRVKWDQIAEEVRVHFSQRLKELGHRPSGWKAGQNILRRELGKELVLLAWAIEDADPALSGNAVSNWLGLVPEERWWLYTQTAAATGHATADRNRGWRKAVRFALTENPIGPFAEENRVPEYFRAAAQQTIFGASDED